jgi:hypothetical protein
MESCAYFATRKFFILAVDGNFETSIDNHEIKIHNAQKVCILNSQSLVTVIGNPYKISDIYKYLLELNKLGYNRNYEEIIKDINEVFNSSNKGIEESLNRLSKLASALQNEDGEVDIQKLIKELESEPELIPILKDSLSRTDIHGPGLAQILIANWDNSLERKATIGYYASIGHNLIGINLDQLYKDSFYFKFHSSSIKADELVLREKDYHNEIISEMGADWENDLNKVKRIMAKGKEQLAKAISDISPLYVVRPKWTKVASS